MKLFLLSSLLALAFGSNDVVVSERDLAVNDRFHMPTVSVTGGPTTFSIAYTHDLALEGGDIKTAKVFATCPNEGGASGATQSLGVNLGTPTFSGVTSTVGVTVTGANAPATTTGTQTSSFCVWYGVGPSGGGYYGYREVAFTITWIFNGAWTATAFTTQAYDPLTKAATQTISATASECAIANPVPVKVGEVICTKLCSSNALFNIATISAFSVAGTPGTFTVLGSSFVDITPTTNALCKEVKYLLPISWFPTLPSETPSTTSVVASGTVTYAAARRMLQEQESPAATGPIIGTQEVTLASVEESSASSVLAGAAVAAAVGAALLI